MVAVKNGARFMAGDLHCNPFGNPSSHHIADGGTLQIVKELSRLPCLLTGTSPGFPKIFDRDSLAMKDPRDDFALLAL
jgi:hypothetical protein